MVRIAGKAAFLLPVLCLFACSSSPSNNPDGGGGPPDAGNPGGDGGCPGLGNGSLATAAPLSAGATLSDCLGPGGLPDESAIHFFGVSTPSGSPAGGYFQISESLTGTLPATLWIEILSSDGGMILPQYSGPADGGPLTSYFAAAAGGTYFLEILASTPNDATPYDVSLQYTPVNDPYKPDGLQSEAKPLSLDAGTTGSYVWAGYVSSARPNVNGNDPSGNGFDDWYSIALATGATHFSLVNVPNNFELQVDILDSSGTKVQSNGIVGFGNPVSLPLTATAGTYYVHIYPQASIMPMPTGLGTKLPVSFTQPYVLTVTQP